MKFRLLTAIIIFSALSGVMTAQEDYFLPLHQYAQRNWRAVSGLAHDNVKSMYIDSSGFVWAGTIEGLTRLDGTSSKTFSTRTHPRMQSNRVVSIDGFSSDTLFVATAMGISKLTDGSFEKVIEESGLTGMTVTVNSRIYASKENEILSIVKGEIKRLSIVNGMPDGSVGAIDSHNDTLFIGMSSGAVVSYDKGVFSGNLCGISSFPVTALKADGTGVIFGNSAGMLYRITGSGCTELNSELPDTGEDRSVKAVSSQHGVIRAVSGSYLISIENGKARYVKNCCGMPGQMSSVVIDSDGSLWMAGDKGVSLFYPGVFATLGKDEGLSSEMVYAMIEDRDGRVWVGTRGGGLFYYTDGSFKQVGAQSGIKGLFIGGLMMDDLGDIWAGTSHGIMKFPAKLPVRAKEVLSAKKGAIPLASVIFQDSVKRIWAGTAKGEIYLFVNGAFSLVRQTGTEKGEYVSSITEDSSGKLWFATSSGLLKFDGESFRSVTVKDGLPDNMVISVYADTSGIVLAGMMRTGLSIVFPDGKIRNVNTGRGLCSDTIYSVMTDSYGYLWFTSTHGIFKLRKDHIIKAANDPDFVLNCFQFDTLDGIRRPENTGGVQPVAMIRRNGELWFPTVEGVVRSKSFPLSRSQNIHTSIDDLILNGKRVDMSGGPVLSGDVSLVEIKYTAGRYMHPERLKIRYRLEPLESNWTYQNERRTVNFEKLSSGIFNFVVEAEDENGAIKRASVIFEVKNSSIISMLSSKILLIPLSFLILSAGIFLIVISRRRKNRKLSDLSNDNRIEVFDIIDVRQDEMPSEAVASAPEEVFIEYNANSKDESPKYEKSRLDDDIAQAYVRELKELMEKERPYTDPELTLPQLAGMLNLSSNILSQVINGHCNLNFYTFVNIYRTEAVIKMMKDDFYKHRSILDLAYDAGFKSKTTFNTIFKKHTGLTPSEFRRNFAEKGENQ